MLIISPHLDDAVFSCGSLIARTAQPVTVVTVCAGIPDDNTPGSDFARDAGYTFAADQVRARRLEDMIAGETLGFAPIHLNCLPDEYDRDTPGRHDRITRVTRQALDLAVDDIVVAPLGLRHPDHQVVAQACLEYGPPRMWFYEELPYRVLWPQFTEPALNRANVSPEMTHQVPYCSEKAAAIDTYASQLLGMDLEALKQPEVYHACR